MVDLNGNECESFANELSETFSVPCLGVAADISDPESIREMADRVENRLGDVSILHNNAASKGSDPVRVLRLGRGFQPRRLARGDGCQS